MSTLETGPKLNWTRDNQMYECYRVWKKKVEFIFCSALADSTPKQLVSYLKYWMGDQGIPLIEKWESTGKLDYSNAEETPATEGGRRRILSSGYKVQTYWDLLDEEFKPKGNKLLSIIELWTHSKQGDKQVRIQDLVKGGPQLQRPKVADIAKRSRASEASNMRQGSRARLRALEAFGFLMLKYAFSHILETLFLSFLTSILTPKVDKNRALELTSINLRHSYIIHLFFNLHEKVMV